MLNIFWSSGSGAKNMKLGANTAVEIQALTKEVILLNCFLYAIF